MICAKLNFDPAATPVPVSTPPLPRGHGGGRPAQRVGGGRHRSGNITCSVPDRKGRTVGFTLIEVLVALAVVGLALGALAGVFSNGLVAHETAADAESALALAEEQLALAGAALRPGNASGNFVGRFAWQTTIALYDDGDKTAEAANSPPRLYRVSVSVAWQDGHRSRQLALSTLRLGPAATPDRQ